MDTSLHVYKEHQRLVVPVSSNYGPKQRALFVDLPSSTSIPANSVGLGMT
jgi:hypothetical protein